MDQGPLTITAAAPLIQRGELTPSDLLEQCFARIDRYEEKVRAWVYLDRERARSEAAQLSDEIKKGHYRGPLHGIPIGIKDIIDVFDMPTGCGSKLWANSYARRDATCVQRLRDAGALILGKTVTTPYAFLDPPPTRNPWNLERTPGGSSSGSAAAVACGMCLVALGTQTGGSLIRPASFCGVYALKPSWGRVSVDGVLPLAPSLDHVGVMTNCVRDLAHVMLTIAERQSDLSVPAPYDYVAEIDNPDGFRHRQLGTVTSYPPEALEPGMAAAFGQLQGRTRDIGWAWSPLPLPPLFGQAGQSNNIIYAVEVARYHSDRFRRHPDDYPPRIRDLIQVGGNDSAVQYANAVTHYQSFREEIESSFVDSWQVIAIPAADGPAPDLSTTGNPSIQSLWSYAGLPVLSLPIARTPDGLPLAVQLICRRWCEDDLLRIATMLESDLGLTPALPSV